ncbi:MAG: hypothetical protein WBC45_01245 [Atribacterota bacterium]
MFNYQYLNDYVEGRYEELLKEAETERMIRKYRVQSPRSFNGSRFFLSHLGKIMINLGTSLQKRYEEAPCAQCTLNPVVKIK